MKLLFDQNLSFKLVKNLEDVFPRSNQVKLIGMHEAGDGEIWEYARANGFTLVSKDSDYSERSALLGHPPKVIYRRKRMRAGRSRRRVRFLPRAAGGPPAPSSASGIRSGFADGGLLRIWQRSPA
jgi:hypothetical protein